MKTLISKAVSFLAVLIFLGSCSTTNDVVSNSGIMKRKYRKGYYVQQPQLFNKQTYLTTGPKAEDVQKQNNSKNELLFTASIEDEPVIIRSQKYNFRKPISRISQTAQKVKHLYDSDSKDFTAFRKEYKEIKTDLRSGLNISKKGGEDSNFALSLLSFASAIIGFFIAGIILGILAVVLGMIALAKRKKGIVFAILGIAFGIADIILVSLYLSTL
jgi:thiol:disulfide interchange protein